METTVCITSRKLDDWRKVWPCSSLTTGYAVFASNGDLVDLGGKLAHADVDGHELTAFCDDVKAGVR